MSSLLGAYVLAGYVLGGYVLVRSVVLPLCAALSLSLLCAAISLSLSLVCVVLAVCAAWVLRWLADLRRKQASWHELTG